VPCREAVASWAPARAGATRKITPTPRTGKATSSGSSRMVATVADGGRREREKERKSRSRWIPYWNSNPYPKPGLGNVFIIELMGLSPLQKTPL
jgi:hypothetical protein